jgi:hypothetical protein
MSIQATDLRKLVKIVRQYEVIYGGGISSSDAAIREECEGLVGLLESELGGRKAPERPKAKPASSLPSLVDAKRKPKESGAPPLASRASELAKLSSPKAARKPEPSEGVKRAAAPKGAASAKGAAKKAQPAGKSAPGKKATKSGRVAAEVPAKAAAKPRDDGGDGAYSDVRSRPAGAVKAAAERNAMIAGKADSSDTASERVDTKKRFAALHLFDAFQQSRLPKYGGFIVCVRFADDKGYAVIEIIGYGNMQDLYPEGETIVFKSVGCKLYAIVEPPGYLLKSVEPVNRPSEQAVPYRFSELLHITTKRFQGIYVGRKPVFMPTSFSVFKPTGEDLAILFYDIADVYSNIQDFLIMILRDRLGIPVPDSRKAAEVIARGIREFRLWLDEA